ncbi:hypothetical protein [Glycomyces paridis]|uniref:Uncharacterized protein n=1 Tax=Glycomyces paridis TaxID=2126555 RepID=A0A4S8PKR3_9ACTN|nr:hypothetical protein [Glycomyces paridis]THV30162.1 hypothetical protein E9998_07265 [Glycomyces paridis]
MHVPPEVTAAMRGAESALRAVFGEHGVPVSGPYDRGRGPGVQIEVDTVDDPAQGVYVGWYVGSAAAKAAVAALALRRSDDLAIRVHGERTVEGLATVRAVLAEAGVRFEEVEDDYRPFTVRVPHEQFNRGAS